MRHFHHKQKTWHNKQTDKEKREREKKKKSRPRRAHLLLGEMSKSNHDLMGKLAISWPSLRAFTLQTMVLLMLTSMVAFDTVHEYDPEVPRRERCGETGMHENCSRA
jgi:hypothetical protein